MRPSLGVGNACDNHAARGSSGPSDCRSLSSAAVRTREVWLWEMLRRRAISLWEKSSPKRRPDDLALARVERGEELIDESALLARLDLRLGGRARPKLERRERLRGGRR